MNHRTYLTIIFTIISASLFAQPRITGINYVSQDTAVLSRNTPPSGIVYYWQGTSCGSSTVNSATTFTAYVSGIYFLRDFISSGSTTAWGTSCASTIVIMPDMTPPVLSNVSAGPVDIGDSISATSNENGVIYLVPNGTAANISNINSAKVSEVSVNADVSVKLPTIGLTVASYIVYAVDSSDNVSIASSSIALVEPISRVLNASASDEIQLYPAVVDDILTIKSEVQVTSAVVYNLQGSEVININTPAEFINMSELNKGIYIVSIKLVNNRIYTGKIIKN